MHIGEKTMSLVIRRRTGFTNALFNKADRTPNKVITLKALAEGPYGKVDSLASYGTVVLVAGGVGITHPVPHIRDLVEGYAKGTVATKRIVLVWVVQSPGKSFCVVEHALSLVTNLALQSIWSGFVPG